MAPPVHAHSCDFAVRHVVSALCYAQFCPELTPILKCAYNVLFSRHLFVSTVIYALYFPTLPKTSASNDMFAAQPQNCAVWQPTSAVLMLACLSVQVVRMCVPCPLVSFFSHVGWDLLTAPMAAYAPDSSSRGYRGSFPHHIFRHRQWPVR